MKEVWMVMPDPNAVGFIPHLWVTKLDAERYARECYPDMSEDKRYAHIYYRKVLSYEPTKGE